MDQAGIATLAVIVVLIAATVGTIGTPLIVDAVDVQPDSPLYSLERAGEGIKGVFAGGQDWEIERAQERADEFVYMVDAGKASEYTWLVEESDVHLLKAAKLADDNEGLQKAIEANVFHLVLLENVKERVPAKAKPAISFAQLQSYASVGVLENVARGVYLKIPEPLKIELDNRLSQIRVLIENLRIENVEPPEFTIRIENYEIIKSEQITLEVENTYTISVIENLSKTITVVAISPTSLRIEPTNAWLSVGDSVDFTATAVYSDGSTADVTLGATWELSNPAVGNISYSVYIDLTRGIGGSYAVFHAEKTGYTWITANYLGHSDRIPVVVSESPPPVAFGELKLTASSDERKVLPHLSIFTMEDAEVTIDSIENLYFVNVGAAVTVGDVIFLFLGDDVYAYYEGAHGIEKGDNLIGFGALRYEPDVYIDAFSDGFWIAKVAWVWTDKNSYQMGETVTVYFKNLGEEPLIFGVLPTWHIERYEDGSWKSVNIYPLDMDWILLLEGIEPGEIRKITWNQREYIGTRENYEEIPAEPGRYRVVWSPGDLETGEPVGEFKSEFIIENIIIYWPENDTT